MKGPKFCVTTSGKTHDYKGDTRKFTKRLILQETYFDKDFEDESLIRKPSKKIATTKNGDLNEILNTLHKLEPVPIHMEKNIDSEEQSALNELKTLSKSTIEIKKADKSDTWVIMDKCSYRDNLVLTEHLHTSTYEEADLDSNDRVFKDLKKLVEKHSSCTTKNEKKFVLDKDWEVANFYVLPKINKCKEIVSRIKTEPGEYLQMELPPTLKSRPICGGPKAVTQGASKLLDRILSPLVPCLRSYVKDEWNFVRIFPKHIPYKAKLISCDIVSLYTSIPTDLGLQALDYWIDKLRFMIQSRFTKAFILELAEFVLRNNYCLFGEKMWHQIIGTSMGSIFAPPYACLTIGFLEETKFYPTLLPSKFDPVICEKIIEFFFRFMDDGTTLLPEDVDESIFLELLNSMHPSIKYTVENPDLTEEDGNPVQKLVFLSLIIFLDEQGNIWTDVFYKDTNTHDYLRFDSHHPEHVKKNIPFVLAKRILVFTTREKAMKRNLKDLRLWLSRCGYPQSIIDKGIHNASIQGPAPLRTNKTIPLITTYFSNYSNKIVVDVTKQLLKNTKNERLQKAFKDVQFVNAHRQPPNLLRQLSHSHFTSAENISLKTPGLFKCNGPHCKLCKFYVHQEKSFTTSNGTIWELKRFANCNSLNVIYFLQCNFCLRETYIGKTGDLRERTNNHISCCRHGSGNNIFDNHVYECAKTNGEQISEERHPFFTLHVMMVISDYDRLLSYESQLHSQRHDTMNRPL